MPSAPLAKIVQKIRQKSQKSREKYLARLGQYEGKVPRASLGCANLAHAAAALPAHIKDRLASKEAKNYAIISAYNDLLSAHQPLKDYPELIKKELWAAGASAHFAGGVPAMCDGITQGYAGMELSLLSRDVIALSVAIALSHNVFDGAFYLGVCDKIVPGLLIGALSFGHLPALFIPSGPMSSGISNEAKSRARQDFAAGRISREELLKSEMSSYHDVGTCTFYGTANSNQMMIELMGLHLPNSAFIHPHTPLRTALVRAGAARLAGTDGSPPPLPVGQMLDERSFINALIGLMATGGSTNHSIHLIAIARAAGVILDWEDFDEISRLTPLLARIYPNGKADVNQFEAAGGLAFVVGELLSRGLLCEDAMTVMGQGLEAYAKNPFLDEAGRVIYRPAAEKSGSAEILRGTDEPFSPDGGLRILKGRLGRAVIKISAVRPQHQRVQAPALIFASQGDFLARFERGELERDFIAVLPFQGPRANGMPELHKLTPPLGILQDRGFAVALITDGRMSGASGKIPAALHLSPEAKLGGAIARLREGDELVLDAREGILDVLIDEDEWAARQALTPADDESFGLGRELFASLRAAASSAETGAVSFGEEWGR